MRSSMDEYTRMHLSSGASVMLVSRMMWLVTA